MVVEITLHDQIPSGKNQVKKVYTNGRCLMIPNKRFEIWRGEAGYEVMIQKQKWPRSVRDRLPLEHPMVAQIDYHPLDRRLRDLPGMLDALWHLLVWSQVIKDDGLLQGVQWKYPWREEGPCILLRLIWADAQEEVRQAGGGRLNASSLAA